MEVNENQYFLLPFPLNLITKTSFSVIGQICLKKQQQLFFLLSGSHFAFKSVKPTSAVVWMEQFTWLLGMRRYKALELL